MDKQQLADWLEERIGEYDPNDYFLVDVDWQPGINKMVVYVDSEQALSLHQCQQLSRYIEAQLDVSELIGLTYSLDVSSPGLDRPLQDRRQYSKHVGRVLRVVTEDGQYIGKLLSMDEAQIEIQQEVPQGPKRKPLYQDIITISFEDIKETFVEIRF